MGSKKRYDKQFKLEAAKLVIDHGYSYKQAADRLGVADWSIRQWVKQLRDSGDLPPADTFESASDSMKKMREENRKLRMENDILKKAAAYFAKDSLH
jgi:transposase-like protein